jgi:hypothetical protein
VLSVVEVWLTEPIEEGSGKQKVPTHGVIANAVKQSLFRGLGIRLLGRKTEEFDNEDNVLMY